MAKEPSKEALESRIRELEAQVAQLTQSQELFPGYLSGLSHDIRTPLNAIIGFAGLMDDEETEREELEMYARMITRSSRRLLTLISNLIDLAKMETDTLQLFSEQVFVPDLIEDLEDEMKEEQKVYNKEHLLLELHQPSNGASLVTADRSRLYQVLKILFDNSLKYTDRGRIELSVHHESPNLTCFSLRDTGKGMEPDLLNQLYQLFPVGNLSRGARIKSRGLGMLVAKELTARMQGELKVNSVPGKGTTVQVVLPEK